MKSLETRIAEDGVAIAAARADLMRRLVASQSADPDYPFPRFSGQMAGIVESWLEERPALAAEDELAAQLSQLRLQDRQTGGAGIGPHRSDLKIQHVRKNLPADLCSTGEQKMLVLALVLAFAKIQLHHREGLTVVLLDDVVAHLDDHHRRVMFQEICSGKANPNLQVWMTGADYGAFADLEHQAQFLTLKNDG
jgi:DNA replication and repair protein RecF